MGDLPTRDRRYLAVSHIAQWWSMGATLIVDDPELVPVLSGTHLLTSEGSVGLAARGDREIL